MAFRTLTAILVLPAVISLALLLVNAAWYQSSMLRMEEVAALKPVVSTDIPEMVWVAVSGRATFENCGVYEAIGEVNRSLDAMTAKDGPGARLELTVARRTMETLTQYVRQIEENLKSNVPVVESERVLAEYNKQLADAKAQSAQIIADARSVGEAVKADITAQAQTEAADMIAKAKAAIEAEKKQAISELQATVADTSVDVAARLIGEDLTEGEHRAIIERYVKEAGSFNGN